MTKLFIYILVIPLIIWGMDSVNINAIFKKNRPYQARLIYMVLIFSLSYLAVNFLEDIVGVMKF